MSEQDYPTEEELKTISDWPIPTKESNYQDLMTFIEGIWWMPDWGWTKKRGGLYYVSTGGWSGNEDIIQAMQKNFIFWGATWVQSRRGGHYIFKVPRYMRCALYL